MNSWRFRFSIHVFLFRHNLLGLSLRTLTVPRAKLRGGDAHVAAKEAAHKGEVGEVVLVAYLLQRLFGVLDGRLHLQYQRVVDDFLGTTSVILTAYAPQVLGCHVQLAGIVAYLVVLFAVLAQQYDKAVEVAQCAAYGLCDALPVACRDLVAQGQQQATEDAYALLIFAGGVLVGKHQGEEVIYGAEVGHNPLALAVALPLPDEEGARGVYVLDEGEYMCGSLADEVYTGDIDLLHGEVDGRSFDVDEVVGREEQHIAGLNTVFVQIDSHRCCAARAERHGKVVDLDGMVGNRIE